LKGPRSHPLTGDENQPLKPKSRRSGAQAALTVSSAEVTASARGSLAYGDHHLGTNDSGHHLGTNDSGHLPTNTAPASGGRPKSAPAGPHSRPRHRNKNGTVLEHEYRPRGVRRVVRPLGAADGARRTWTWPARAQRDRHPSGGRAAALRPSGRRWHRKQHRSRSGREPDTRQLPAPRTANALLPRSLREGASRCPRGGRPRLGAPPSPAWMMNILEAEGRGETTAWLALPHHEVYSHHPG
jgi:hypothetical protein